MTPEPLRLYLDQMIRSEVSGALRLQGHNVIRASEIGQNRADDAQILQTAISEDRILITLDEHFGDWAVLPLDRHPGVVRIKVHPPTAERIIDVLGPFLMHTGTQFRNHLVILSAKRAKWIQTT